VFHQFSIFFVEGFPWCWFRASSGAGSGAGAGSNASSGVEGAAPLLPPVKASTSVLMARPRAVRI